MAHNENASAFIEPLPDRPNLEMQQKRAMGLTIGASSR
jgi:hypothetical protein